MQRWRWCAWALSWIDRAPPRKLQHRLLAITAPVSVARAQAPRDRVPTATTPAVTGKFRMKHGAPCGVAACIRAEGAD